MRSEGRPNLYTDEQLLNVLKDYQKSHPNQKIKYAQLEKATGIKVHIWKYQMRDTIEAINKKIAGANIPARIGYNLPSVEDMLINIENEPAMLKYYFVVRQIKRGCFRQIKTVRQEASGKHPVTLLSVYLAHWKKQQTTHAY